MFLYGNDTYIIYQLGDESEPQHMKIPTDWKGVYYWDLSVRKDGFHVLRKNLQKRKFSMGEVVRDRINRIEARKKELDIEEVVFKY